MSRRFKYGACEPVPTWHFVFGQMRDHGPAGGGKGQSTIPAVQKLSRASIKRTKKPVTRVYGQFVAVDKGFIYHRY